MHATKCVRIINKFNQNLCDDDRGKTISLSITSTTADSFDSKHKSSFQISFTLCNVKPSVKTTLTEAITKIADVLAAPEAGGNAGSKVKGWHRRLR